MATPVMSIRRNNNGLAKLMSIGKIAGGMATGNPMMAASGGLDLASQSQNNQQMESIPTPESAMSRRMNATEDSSFLGRLAALRDGEQALNELPMEVRQEYTRPLFNTIMAAHKDYMDRMARGEQLS